MNSHRPINDSLVTFCSWETIIWNLAVLLSCEAWLTHRDHDSVGVRNCHTLGFRSITFEEMHKFNSIFTEGLNTCQVGKWRSSTKF